MKTLDRMLEQFRTRHGRLPESIEVSPLALTVLAARRSVAPRWRSVPVICRPVDPRRLTQDQGAQVLGVDVVVGTEARLVAFSLR